MTLPVNRNSTGLQVRYFGRFINLGKNNESFASDLLLQHSKLRGLSYKICKKSKNSIHVLKIVIIVNNLSGV